MYTYTHSTGQCSKILQNGSGSAEASAACEPVSTQLMPSMKAEGCRHPGIAPGMGLST